MPRHLIPLVLVLAIALSALATGLTPVSAQDDEPPSLTVTSVDDNGDGLCDTTCTLRDALLAASASDVGLRILFDLPPGTTGVAVISLLAPLPLLDTPGTVIDGTSQPGYSDRPLVYLDGSAAAKASGLVATMSAIEIRGIAVGNFERYGLAAIGEEADGVRFIANWAGLTPDGRAAAPNRLSGIAVLAGADEARVGDVCLHCGNRLAGNSNPDRTGHGLLVGGRSFGARIVANTIGLDRDGRALPNDDGILIVDGALASVGGRSPGQGNLISGNLVAGIEVRDSNFLPLRIEGNRIGLNRLGLGAVPNDVGIFIQERAGNVVIGAPLAAAANVIAGNRVGIAIESLAREVIVQGNLIGLDRFGSSAVPNLEDGISIVAGARDVLIGGAGPGEGNYIAGSANAIVVADASTANIAIRGNVLGLSVAGTVALPNATGILVIEATSVQIGGRETGDGNTIVATQGPAVVLDAVSRADVRANRIGITPDDVPRGNGVGVVLRGGSSDNMVQENVFAANLAAGIQVVDSGTVRNRLTRNVFLTAPGLPIDLGTDGPTPNDPDDVDEGPNGLLNAPTITDYHHDGRVVTAGGNGPPGQRLEIYRVRSPRFPEVVAHRSGSGGGVEFLASARVGADGLWEARFAVSAGDPITALAVTSSGNTSEFARNLVPLPPELLTTGFSATGWFGAQTPIEDALAIVEDRLLAVFSFDAGLQDWRFYRPDFAFLSNLDSLATGTPVWVQLSDGPVVRWVQRQASATEREIALRAGLNFESWTGPPTALADAFPAIDQALQAVFRWNRSTAAFDLIYPSLGPDATVTLETNDLLWLRLDAPALWRQPPR